MKRKPVLNPSSPNDCLERVSLDVKKLLPPGYKTIFKQGYTEPQIEVRDSRNNYVLAMAPVDDGDFGICDWEKTADRLVKRSWKSFLKHGR